MHKGIVITVRWCAALIVCLRVPLPPAAAASPAPAVPVQSREAASRDWKLLASADTLDLYLNEQYAGTMVHSVTVREGGKGIVAQTRISVESSGLSPSASASMKMQESRTYGADGALTSARQSLTSASGSSEWNCVREPNGGWNRSIVAGGIRRSLPAPRITENLHATYSLFERLRKQTLKAGDTFPDSVFELASGRTISLTTRCVETPSPANGSVWKFVIDNGATGHEERWTIDTGAVTLYQEVWPFTAKKRGGRDRNGARQDAPAAPLFEAFAISVPRPASDTESIRLTLDSSFAPDTSVWRFYRHEGNRWIVSGIARTCAGNKRPPPRDTAPERFIVATATMQSDESRIRKLADSLVKNKQTRCDSIAACNEFVYRRLEKRFTPTFSSAIETLGAGFGDCGEHAVLLGALLRSISIPARIVLGLVYEKDRARYLFHAWVLARSREGAWLFVDPAYGIFPASRDRIPLIIDDEGDAATRIVRLIGRMKIDYVKTR